MRKNSIWVFYTFLWKPYTGRGYYRTHIPLSSKWKDALSYTENPVPASALVQKYPRTVLYPRVRSPPNPAYNLRRVEICKKQQTPKLQLLCEIRSSCSTK